MNKKTRAPSLIIMAVWLISLGCATTNVHVDTATVGELRDESQTVELGDAEQVRATLKMGAGELNIESGAEALVEANFTYDVAEWKPAVTYEVAAGTGRLTIRQPNTEQIAMRDVRYKWRLAFNEEVPLNMRIEAGAGTGNLNLGELNVTQLDIQLGAGDYTIDLNGNQSLQHLECDMGAGNVTLDLNGAWKENVNVDLQSGIGQTVLRLPPDIGVHVTIDRALGDVNANGLIRQGNAYVNETYGKSDVTLEIYIQAGVGQINLEVAD